MDFKKEHFRAMIHYDFKSNLTEKQCAERLSKAYGDSAPSERTIYRWYNEFKFGRSSVADEFREGRPSTAITSENIEKIREMIFEDRHVTYREIEASLGIDMKQINTILHEHLAVKKLCSRWIPHNLTIAQKNARVK